MKKIVLFGLLIFLIPEKIVGEIDKQYPISLDEDCFESDAFDALISETKRNITPEQISHKPYYLEVILRRIGIALLMKYTAFMSYVKTKYYALTQRI